MVKMYKTNKLTSIVGGVILSVAGLVGYTKAAEAPIKYEYETRTISCTNKSLSEIKNPKISSNWTVFETEGDLYAADLTTQTNSPGRGYQLTNSGNAKNHSVHLDTLVYQENNRIYSVNLRDFAEGMKTRASIEPVSVPQGDYIEEVYTYNRKNMFTNFVGALEQPVFTGSDIVFIANEGPNKNVYRWSVSRRRCYPVASSVRPKKSLVTNSRFIAWSELNNKPNSNPALVSAGGDYDLQVFDINDGSTWTADSDPNASTDVIAISASSNGQIAFMNNYPHQSTSFVKGKTKLSVYYPFQDVNNVKLTPIISGIGTGISVVDNTLGTTTVLVGLDYINLSNQIKLQTIQKLELNGNNCTTTYPDSSAEQKLNYSTWYLTNGNVTNKLTSPKIYPTGNDFPLMIWTSQKLKIDGTYEDPIIEIKNPVAVVDADALLTRFVNNYFLEGAGVPGDFTEDGKVESSDFKFIFGDPNSAN